MKNLPIIIKVIFFIFSILYNLTNFAKAQSVDEIPWSNKKYLKNTSIDFSEPKRDFSREQAGKDYQTIRLKYEKDKTQVKTRANYIKIAAEGVTELINLIPIKWIPISIITSPVKEWAFQNLDKHSDEKIDDCEKKFNEAILNSFETNVKKSIIADNGLTFEASLKNFKSEIQVFKNNLKTENYNIVAPKVDELILKFMEKNRNENERRFEEIKNQDQSRWNNIESDWNNKLKELEYKTFEYDKIILEKVKENAESLQKFSEGVNKKFQQQQSDIDAMKKEIKENGEKHENNKKEIEKLKNKVDKTQNDILMLNQLTHENRQLINENTYKIDVITDVLYDNVNTSGKMKLLDMRYKDDKNNSYYKKEIERLNNIQTLEDIKHQLATGKEVLTLAKNLGLSDDDYKSASKIIAIGEVIAGGTMAYFTGNPIAGLQAINGAFSIFDGDSKNPEFDAIMQQFKAVNEKLDKINDKLDTLNKNLIEFRNLTIDLHQENQRRFDNIEEKLDKIQADISNIKTLIYAQTTEGLKEENITGYDFIWKEIKEANSLNDLNQLYNGSQKLKNTVNIIYNNTENRSIDSKPFLHFNNYDKDNYWEYKIFTPMLNITQNIYNDLNKLEPSIDFLYNFRDILKMREDTTINYYQEIFPKNNWDVKKLIYPQAIITLTNFTTLFEPYYYFSSSSTSNEFSIPDENVLKNINYVIKNKSLKTQFENILKDNRTAILQTNIISGVPIISYIKKHLEDPSFQVAEKKKIYELLLSENYFLKVNISNSIVYNYIFQQQLHAEKLNKLLNCNCSINEYDTLLNDFNRHFANSRYELGKIQNNGITDIVLVVKPTKITGVELSNNPIILPLPPFEYIYENRMMYPSYLDQLYENMEILTNKVIKYDIVQKMNENNFTNLKLLK